MVEANHTSKYEEQGAAQFGNNNAFEVGTRAVSYDTLMNLKNRKNANFYQDIKP